MIDHTSPGAGPGGRTGPEARIEELGSSCNPPHSTPSPWVKADPVRTAERERLIELHREAWRADPARGALAHRAILRSDFLDILATGRLDLLDLLRRWTALLPAPCRDCGVRLCKVDDVGGYTITTAAIARPRFAIVSGFCEACTAKGHTAIQAAAASALQREGVAAEVIGEARG